MVSMTRLCTIDKRYNPKLERHNPERSSTVDEPMTQHRNERVGKTVQQSTPCPYNLTPLLYTKGIYGGR